MYFFAPAGKIEAPARNIYVQVWITYKNTDTVGEMISIWKYQARIVI